MNKTVMVTSVFDTEMEKFFAPIQKLETLQYIAKSYSTFESVDKENDIIWKLGKQ